MTDTDGHSQGSDAALLQQAAQGGLAALEQLFARYRRPVFQLALGITRDVNTAEEVLQDTFYRLHTHAAELDGSLPLLPWLYRVAANLAHNQNRRRRFWSEPFHALAERLRAPARRSPEYIAEQRELQAIVRATIEALPATQREVLVLYYLHDYSIPEIATILACPEGTVKSRLHHARKLLKARLLRHYGGAVALLDQI